MKPHPRHRGHGFITLVRFSILFMALFSLILHDGCGPRETGVTHFDFIEEFNPETASLERVTAPVGIKTEFLEDGFREDAGHPGMLLESPRAALSFDCPWKRGATKVSLTLRTDQLSNVTVSINDNEPRTVPVNRLPEIYNFKLEAGTLKPRGNRLSIEAPVSAGLRLTRLTLPPPLKTVTVSKRRIRLLPGPPDSEISYRLTPAAGSRLRFETVRKFYPSEIPTGTLTYEIIAGPDSDRQSIFKRNVPLRTGVQGEHSARAEVDISSLAGREIELTFVTRFKGDPVPLSGTVGWGNPRLLPLPVGGETPPALIIWLADALRADHLGCYEYERETSPNIDGFAAEAIRFENVISQSSWTKASIASLFTGLTPSYHGAVGRHDRLHPNVATLAERLAAAGYTTAAFSANASFHARYWDVSRGFDEVTAYFQKTHYESTLAMVTDAVDWLERHRNEPVFLFLHTVDPHSPYVPLPIFREQFGSGWDPPADEGDVDRGDSEPSALEEELRWSVDAYDGAIAGNDARFGRFLKLLKHLGRYDSSLIVFTSDHGEEFLDHGNWRHGKSLYQEQLRLPLIIRLPGGKRSGTVVKGSVRGVDLMPSFLEWLGVGGFEGQGQSFARVVDAGEEPLAAEIISEHDLDYHKLYSVIAGDHKYILRLQPRLEEALYDLKSDPAEQHNLIATKSELAAPLIDLVNEYRRVTESGTRLIFISPESRLAKGEIITGSPITEIRAVNLRQAKGRSYGLSEDRHRLWFTIWAGEAPLGLIFDQEQPDRGATLTLEQDGDGEAWQVFLGAGEARAPAGPVALTGTELVTRRFDSGPMVGKSAGCYIWRIPQDGDQAVAPLSDEEQENLRALGYIE